MSELPNLPPAPRRTRPVPPGGLDAAVAGGRRRRARFAAGASAATVATAFALAALLSTSATDNDSLRTASPAPQVSSAAVEPSPSADADPQPAPTPRPGATGDPGAGPAAGSSPQPGASPAAAPDQEPGPRDDAPKPPPPAQRPAYVERTDEDARGTSICSAFRAGTGACSQNEDNGPVVRRGTPVVLTQLSCSGANGAGDNVDVFDGGQETELVVRRGAEEVFRFSSTVRYVQGPHERRLRPGKCLEYKQVWDGVDTAGRPVPTGEYQLELTVMPDREFYEFEDGKRMFEEKGRPRTSRATVRLVD